MRPDELLTLERRLSAERLGPYRAAAAGDLSRAVTSYERNSELSAAFWAVLGDLEVLVRNAMDSQLRAWSVDACGRPDWYRDRLGLFTAATTREVAAARRRAGCAGGSEASEASGASGASGRRAESGGRVVAELPLGFWRYLLSSRYERTLWLPCLRDAFPGIRGQGMRRDVHDALRDLHLLRNRIAHHEPIHNRPLGELHAVALTTAGWICPTTRDWIASRSRVPALLAENDSDSGRIGW